MLDTLKYAKRLREAGFTEQQADAHADALWEAIEDTVATKQDIQLVQKDIQVVRQEIHELDARIDGRFKEMEARIDGRFTGVDGRFRLLYWMVGFNLALTAGVLFKLLAG